MLGSASPDIKVLLWRMREVGLHQSYMRWHQVLRIKKVTDAITDGAGAAKDIMDLTKVTVRLERSQSSVLSP